MTLREKLILHNNDYSHFEPFIDTNPIPSSIVIPVYNELDIFKKMLSNLQHQPEINKWPGLFEIVIINDGSKQNINQIVITDNFPCRLNYFNFEHNQGRAKARNKGIRLSSNELTFIIDSDMLLPHNYFNEHWKVHNSNRKAVGTGFTENISPLDSRIELLNAGKDIHPNISKDFRFYKDMSRYERDGDKGIYYLIKDTDWFKQFGHQRKIGMWTLPYMVVSHNISVRRENLMSVGCFDERFIGWGCEDTYLGAKLIGSNCYVIPVCNTVAFRIKHSPRTGTEESLKQELFKNMALYEKLLDEE